VSDLNDVSDTDALLQRLLDIEALKQLKARYFRSLDQKHWDDFGQVFAHNAALEVPEADVTQHGRDAIVAFVSNALTGARTVHHGHMPEIELTGPDTARGTWAMFDYVEWPATDRGDRVGLQGYGHYIEEYAREGGRWCISRSRLERVRLDALPAAVIPPEVRA
jgi:hypothetical protein